MLDFFPWVCADRSDIELNTDWLNLRGLPASTFDHQSPKLYLCSRFVQKELPCDLLCNSRKLPLRNIKTEGSCLMRRQSFTEHTSRIENAKEQKTPARLMKHRPAESHWSTIDFRVLIHSIQGRRKTYVLLWYNSDIDCKSYKLHNTKQSLKQHWQYNP